MGSEIFFMRELPPAAVLMLDIIENKDDDPLNKHAFPQCLKMSLNCLSLDSLRIWVDGVYVTIFPIFSDFH